MEEVTEGASPDLLEPLQRGVGRAHHAQADVLGGSGPHATELQREPTLEHHVAGIPVEDACQETIVDDELAQTLEVATCHRGSGAKSLLQRGLERGRCGERARHGRCSARRSLSSACGASPLSAASTSA